MSRRAHFVTHRSRRGFTLPELLLVVMMTATLASLLLPVFIRASQPQPKTPDSICASNLKQIGLGILQYAQDYDERMPVLTYRSNKVSWRSLITPYIGTTPYFSVQSIRTMWKSRRETRQPRTHTLAGW
jgi:prepilin-type N-terminal cleavage/methylation domain-containing protein